MGQVVEDARILIKRSTTTGEVPTIPTSSDHTDGTWIKTDIYIGEWFINVVDNLSWVRLNGGILQIPIGLFLSLTLASGKIYVGNVSNVGTAVTPSGDVTITNAGVTAIGASKVLNAMINSVAWSKLTSTPTTVSGYGITDILAQLLTGYTSGSGTIASTDSILQAIQKLNGNDALKELLSNKATSFGTVNNTLYPTIQAVKTYADSLVVGLIDDRGNFDASGGGYPTANGSGTAGAILKGDLYFISVAGAIGAVGSSVRALVDTPGQTAGNWDVLNVGLGYAPENSANKDTDSTFAANSDTKYPSQKAVKTAMDLKANLASPALTGNPTAPTQSQGDNSTKIASTSYVDTAVANASPPAVKLFNYYNFT